MALDLEHLKTVVELFNGHQDLEYKAQQAKNAEDVTKALRSELPALCSADLAAVAYYVASLFATLREVPMARASNALTESAVAYTFAAARLLGMSAE